jgi:hypothetical protein
LHWNGGRERKDNIFFDVNVSVRNNPFCDLHLGNVVQSHLIEFKKDEDKEEIHL